MSSVVARFEELRLIEMGRWGATGSIYALNSRNNLDAIVLGLDMHTTQT